MFSKDGSGYVEDGREIFDEEFDGSAADTSKQDKGKWICLGTKASKKNKKNIGSSFDHIKGISFF